MENKFFFSVIINNYNYARYLPCCIESVLSQTFTNYELIIVDDGSTDSSIDVINKYADRAIVIKKDNGGQGSAYNAGFEACSGDLILFLDADDLLLPEALEVISQTWVPGAAKLHYKLEIIDENGKRSGVNFPDYLDEGNVRFSIARFGSYASPPASGNVYSRHALEQILPMPSEDWRIAADSYTIFLSPFSGDVISVREVLGLYRIDYSKKCDLASMLVFNNSPSTPWESYSRAVLTAKKIQEILIERLGVKECWTYESPAILKLRLISFKLFNSNHVIENDSYINIFIALLHSLSIWRPYSLAMRIKVFIWFLLFALSPSPLAIYLAKFSIKLNGSNKKDL